MASLALAVLLALRATTYRAFTQQQRSLLSWRPFAQARSIRQQDLTHLARLMGNDATLVTAWRQSKQAISAYTTAVSENLDPTQLEALRQKCLPSLWDIAQRLFLESDPGTADSSPHSQAYGACADLLLFCDDQGAVLLEETTRPDPNRGDFGKVLVQFPLDPSRDAPPSRHSLASDPFFQSVRSQGSTDSAYWAYGPSQLYHAVAVSSPVGVIILGDRVDAQMVGEASQLAGQAETVALRQTSLLATTFKNPSPADVLLMSSWVAQLNESRVMQVKFHGQDYLAACYPLGPEGQQPPGWMLFLKTTEKLDGLARQQEWITAGLVVAAALAALAMAAPLANRIARPLRDLSKAMAQVGQGDLDAQAPAEGPREIVQAAEAFNHMVEGLRQKETLEKFVSKLEQLRKVADPQDPLVRDQTQFGEYLISERLGVGGMATVYRALPVASLEAAGQVAIKVIHRSFAQDAEYQLRFRREFEIMQRLDHPGLVRVLESGDLNGLLYITMEYVDGENLRQVLERRGPLDVASFVRLAIPVLEAVQAAHDAGVTHRDLKPENLMVCESGVKVMDFGLATALGTARVTQSGDTVGTPRYLAPEQITKGSSEASSDQYSLGVVFFEMLTGVTPFQGEHPMAILLMHLSEAPPRLRDVRAELPEKLENILQQMLVKDPNERFRDLREIREALLKLGSNL